jgi:SecD/SecF fusion protein
MQHNVYRGRLTAIAVVLFIGLFGIPFVGGGIFPLARLFDTSVPWNKKHDLRPGLDISGGISLLYEIKQPPGGAASNLSEQVAEALKRRVDPDGVRNLIWRPQGPTRLEIQMPLGQNSEEAKQVREELALAQQELEATNIRIGDVRSALQIADRAERERRVLALAGGHPARKPILQRMLEVSDRLQEAIKKNDVIAKVDAERELRDPAKPDHGLEAELEGTNLSVRLLQNQILDFYQTQIEKFQRDRKQDKVNETLAERNKKLDERREAAANYPQRVEAINKFVAAFDRFAKIKGSVDDAEDLKRLLRGSGVLEFHIVVTDFASQVDGMTARQMVERLRREGPVFRPGDTMKWYEVDSEDTVKGGNFPVQEYAGRLWVLCYTTPDKSMIRKEGGRSWGLERAYPDFDGRTGESVVGFKFDAYGSALFGDLSGSHIGQPLAIVLDEKIISAPNLISRIDGQGIITGQRTDAELNYLIRTLNAGSLPARLNDEPISERVISPSLGRANLDAGFRSCIIGLVLVAIFLAGYYYRMGVIAFIAVLMNTIIIIGVLALFRATFTLPGIAAMVLTLGAAVDANVLIFERLREEELRGLSLRMALRNAYDRAFSAILDSNLVTIITSVVLYAFGSEEVKGFGLTLLIGIACSLFTALFVTRVVFDIMIERFGVTKLGSLPLTFPKWNAMLNPKIDWIGKSWIFAVVSLIILGFGLTAFITEGRKMYDIEFVSGTSVQFELKEPASQPEVMALINTKEFEQVLPAVQVVAVGNKDKELEFEVVTPNEKSNEVRDALMRALGTRLNIDPQTRFENVDAQDEAALTAGTIRPADEAAINAFPWARATIQSHQGGVIFVLENMEPPLTAKQIADRIDRARLQPDRGDMPYRRMDVEVPTDPKQPAKSALVIISDENLTYDTDRNKWEEGLARPLWKLVVEAVNKPAALKRVTNVNAQVAQSTMMDAILALTVSMLLVMVYIWLRFGNFKYGTATVIAMLHDVVIVIGVIGLSHYLANFEFARKFLLIEPFRMNLTLVAAILTVMGYSMVDTIVVFDRIRENRGKFGYIDRNVINESINQTLSRTLLTGGITIIMLFVMYVFGGPGIHGFTYALLIGIIIGTYSSIAIAAPILLFGGKDVRKTPKPPTGGETKVERKQAANQLEAAGALKKATGMS